MISISDYDFDLPDALIAQQPLAQRGDSRLLDCVSTAPRLVDRTFTDITSLLAAGDCLVLNNTKVIPARLFGQKDSGGRVEIMLERVLSEHTARVQCRASKAPRVGQQLQFAYATAVVLANEGRFLDIEFHDAQALEIFQQHGQLPLPPYIKRQPDASDLARYQTVYAKQQGAVAAPTAGLHFDEHLLQRCRDGGVSVAEVTLHVGAGTFLPLQQAQLSEARLHSEKYMLSADNAQLIKQTKAAGGRVIAVGTTVMRTLEALMQTQGELGAHAGETDIFIKPGFSFSLVDAMITNFHLPRSSLLMLVAAFIGYENMRRCYQHAIDQQYRFFSYGDAMFLTKHT